MLIHGDCWLPNAVRTPDDQVVLIDWEGAGKGAAILDLGSLILRCQYDTFGGIPSTLTPERIAAAIAGYVSRRLPTPSEMHLLPDAIRFPLAWVGAWLLGRLPEQGWSTNLEQAVARIQHGLTLTEPTTERASHYFAEALQGRDIWPEKGREAHI